MNRYMVAYETVFSPASRMVLCEDGEFHSTLFVGPGGFGARVYKTLSGAERAAKRLGRGIPVAICVHGCAVDQCCRVS